MCTFAFTMDNRQKAYRPCIATIGFFDGVHNGHLCLIRQLKEEAERKGLLSLLITFDRHPRTILHPEESVSLLTTQQEKVDLLRQTGTDEVVVLPFTLELSRLTAREFMQKVLREQLGVAALLLGYDHHFGRGGGSWDDYRAWGNESGIEVVRATELTGEHVSSSRCRQLLTTGDVSSVANLLGRRYALGGQVVPGFHVGHELGFPTANIKPDEGKLVPLRGVYAVWAILADGTRYRAMLNIGNRPTIGNGDGVSVEVNLLDFHGNLYGQRIAVEFVGRLRDERCFASREALIRQLQYDKESAEHLLQDTF